MKRCLVVGAGSALGLNICQRLTEKGVAVRASMRSDHPKARAALNRLGAEIVTLDLATTSPRDAAFVDIDAAILTPILSVSARVAEMLSGVQSVVFFSSNNVAIDPTDSVYAGLLAAEASVRAARPDAVIIRPTMIYGYPGDGNLARLMRAMRASPIVAIPGRGAALQQPIYVKDLASIAVEAAMNDGLRGRTISAAGPAPCSQRALYEAVANVIGKRPIIAPTPTGLGGTILGVLEGVGLRAPVKAAQLRRAGFDKTPRAAPALLGTTTLADGLARLAEELARPGAAAP